MELSLAEHRPNAVSITTFNAQSMSFVNAAITGLLLPNHSQDVVIFCFRRRSSSFFETVMLTLRKFCYIHGARKPG
jgi:hypothetical protein